MKTYEFFVSEEPLDCILHNECEYDPTSLTTKRWRRVNNELAALLADRDGLRARTIMLQSEVTRLQLEIARWTYGHSLNGTTADFAARIAERGREEMERIVESEVQKRLAARATDSRGNDHA